MSNSLLDYATKPFTAFGLPNPFGIIDDLSGKSANETNLQMTKDTNKTNKEIADANNQMQIGMWHEQQQMQWDMWNAENRYNSPAAQKERLRQAGINPALGLLNGANAGQASAMTSPSAPQLQTPTMQAGHVDPLQYDKIVNAMLGSFGTFADVAQKNAITEGVNIENQFKAQDALSKIAERQAAIGEKLSNMGVSNWKSKALQQEYLLNQRTMESLENSRHLGVLEQASRIQYQNQQMYESMSRQSLNEFALKAQQMKLPIEMRQLQVTVEKTFAEIGNLAANTKLTDAQREHELVKRIETELKAQGCYISNSNAQELADLAKKQYEANIKKLEYDASGLDAGFFKIPAPDKLRGWFGGLMPANPSEFLWPKRR